MLFTVLIKHMYTQHIKVGNDNIIQSGPKKYGIAQ